MFIIPVNAETVDLTVTEKRNDFTTDKWYNSSHNVTRNEVLNAYQLDIIPPQIYENQLLYVEVDTLDEITVTFNRTEVDGDLRTPTSYVYYDFGVGGIGDFDLDFEFYYDYRGGATNDWRGVVAGFWQSIGTRGALQQTEDGLCCVVIHEEPTSKPELTLNYHWDGGNNWNDTDAFDGYMNYDQLYYFTMNKSGVNVGLYCYSNSIRTILVEEATITLPSDATYRYFYTMQSIGGASANADKFYIQAITFNGDSTGFFLGGTLYFNDVLINTTEIGLWIGANVTLNNCNVSLRISNDNSSWFQPVNGDYLRDNLNIFYIEQYNYSSLYTEFNFTGNSINTPYLNNCTVWHNLTVSGGISTITWMIILIFALLSSIVIIGGKI